MYKIYSLNCPLTNEIRYIGYTSLSLEKRLSNHISESSKKSSKATYKINWIKSLKNKNSIPTIHLIAVVEDYKFWEIYYIDYFKKIGCNLVNLTEGGDGILGYKHTEETKRKLSILGKGRIVSKETKKKISESSKGKKISKEIKLKMSYSQKGKPKNIKSIEKMKQTKTGKNYINLYGETKATLLKNNLKEKMKNNKYAINPKLRKIIYQYDLDNNFIREFNYSKELKDLNYNIDQITRVCKCLRKSYKNFLWRYNKLI